MVCIALWISVWLKWHWFARMCTRWTELRRLPLLQPASARSGFFVAKLCARSCDTRIENEARVISFLPLKLNELHSCVDSWANANSIVDSHMGASVLLAIQCHVGWVAIVAVITSTWVASYIANTAPIATVVACLLLFVTKFMATEILFVCNDPFANLT